VAHAYAKQKFFEALYSLVGNEALRMRLTYAADALIQLQPHQLPEKMREDFEQLRRDLTRTPLSHPYGYERRTVTPQKAVRLAKKILSMYTQLLGGLM
jgi:hypothetical protein